MKTVSLSGSSRKSVGKKGAANLRVQEKTPAVLYGGDKQIHFSISENDAKKIVFTPNVYLIELEIDGESVDIYRGDGIILSTPTGSTAYSMATGGPILHPGVEAIIVSAICPISLSSRPIVVPAGARLIIKPLGNKNHRVKIWQDGVGSALITEGEQCIIQKAQHHAQMLILNHSPSYYRTLSQKLHWAGSLANNKNGS